MPMMWKYLFGDGELVRVGVVFDPMVAREACRDRTVICGRAVGRDLCVRDDPCPPGSPRALLSNSSSRFGFRRGRCAQGCPWRWSCVTSCARAGATPGRVRNCSGQSRPGRGTGSPRAPSQPSIAAEAGETPARSCGATRSVQARDLP